jgi:hypothetical protein
VALVGTGLFASTGGAEGLDTFYLTDVYGHPVEPYAELPDEVAPGIPGTYVELQKAPLPVRCESISAIVEPSIVVDGVANIISEGRYNNPSKAWAINPGGARETKAEVGTFPGGPRSYAECPTTTQGQGEATWGRYVSDKLSIESLTSESSNKKAEGEELVVTETTNKLQGLKVGDLSIASILSWMKVEFRPNVEPTVSYEITFSGIKDGQGFSGANPDGFSMQGKNMGGKDFVKQFNEQANAYEKQFEPLGKYGLSIGEARFGISPRSGRHVFHIFAGEGNIGFAARRNQGVGHGFGMRFGTSKIAGRYGTYGEG